MASWINLYFALRLTLELLKPKGHSPEAGCFIYPQKAHLNAKDFQIAHQVFSVAFSQKLIFISYFFHKTIHIVIRTKRETFQHELKKFKFTLGYKSLLVCMFFTYNYIEKHF